MKSAQSVMGRIPDYHSPEGDMHTLMDAHKMDNGMHDAQKRAAEINADNKRHGAANAQAAKPLEAYRAVSGEPKK